MAKDDETGVDAVSQDGAGATDDELAKRRKGGSSASRAELEAEQAKLDAEDEKPGDTGEEEDGQLFVWEQGRRVTLGTLVARNIDVEHAFVFTGKRVKGRGGLMALDEKSLVLVRTLAGPVKVVPTHDDDEKVKSVVIESHVNSKVVMPAESEDAVELLRPVLDRLGYDLVKRQTAAAV
jgi:hypothetical protein